MTKKCDISEAHFFPFWGIDAKDLCLESNFSKQYNRISFDLTLRGLLNASANWQSVSNKEPDIIEVYAGWSKLAKMF